ncbi:TPA: hypothetical protein N0F65_006354 [Lagenidium giganteum]|uniref:CREG-like beta-barrel domain-containing protein n=1 Tax=Lagenidium giganteum TaxID=4803 RepID=A0AAV2YCI9_9STRA|nr:TPA: hypothetical protein N0F65_006354 [Lagenidium giganteum]
MTTMTKSMTTLLLLLLLSLSSLQCEGRRNVMGLTRLQSAAPDKHARHARILVHTASWATISTISDKNGGPFGHIVSYSDGVGEAASASTGEVFFYMTTMDETANNLAKNPRGAVSISMAQDAPCKNDVQDPTCWKLTLLGDIVPVEAGDAYDHALDALFSRHPQMKYWPRNHAFQPYVLKLKEAILLDFYGGAKHITPEDYYSVQLD